jgi:hypothetical protein
LSFAVSSRNRRRSGHIRAGVDSRRNAQNRLTAPDEANGSSRRAEGTSAAILLRIAAEEEKAAAAIKRIKQIRGLQRQGSARAAQPTELRSAFRCERSDALLGDQGSG